MQNNWGSTDTPGKVYEVLEDDRIKRVFKGDLLLCLVQSGDNFYSYVRLHPSQSNNETLYFTTGEFVSGYARGHKDLYPGMKPCTPAQMIEALMPDTYFLISREEADERICVNCETRPSGKEKLCSACVAMLKVHMTDTYKR